jgi:hypothetical protein
MIAREYEAFRNFKTGQTLYISTMIIARVWGEQGSLNRANFVHLNKNYRNRVLIQICTRKSSQAFRWVCEREICMLLCQKLDGVDAFLQSTYLLLAVILRRFSQVNFVILHRIISNFHLVNVTEQPIYLKLFVLLLRPSYYGKLHYGQQETTHITDCPLEQIILAWFCSTY